DCPQFLIGDVVRQVEEDLRVVMVIGIYMQKSQQCLGGVPCILMDHRDRTKAQQEHDHALGQLERRNGAKGGAAAMPLGCFGVSYDRCGYMLHEGSAIIFLAAAAIVPPVKIPGRESPWC